MIKCRKCVEFIVDYLDGTLPPEQAEEFQRHLDKCPPCRQYLDSYADTIRMCKHSECCKNQTLPDDVPDALVKAILESRKKGT